MNLSDMLQAPATGMLAAAVQSVELPPPWLPEWNGLCAAEYALAVLRLRVSVADAVVALTGAAALLAVGA